MKSHIISLLALAFITGCSSVPEKIKPHDQKYTVQVIKANAPQGIVSWMPSSSEENDKQAEAIFSHPDTKLTAFPIVHVQAGGANTNDQTKSVMLPEDYSIVDGKAVAKEKECKLGKFVSVEIENIEGDTISYKLDVFDRKIKGHDDYKVGEGITVSIPFMENSAINTRVTQKMNSWVLLGGLSDKDSKGNASELIFCVRIIPPKQ